MTTKKDPDRHDIGHDIIIWFDADGLGFHWRHPKCRAWMPLRFQPDPKSTGHTLLAGGKDNVAALTIGGSLLCPVGCGTHGHIKNGRWEPC